MDNNKLIKEQFKKAQNGDKEARDTLIVNNYGLVITMVKKFNREKFDHEVLKQEGLIGLIKAVDTYDIERGSRFSTYACLLIKGEILRYIRDRDENIKWRMKIKDKETYRRIQEARTILAQEFKGEPTTKEIALLIGEDEKEVEGIIGVLENTTSISYTKYQSKKNNNEITVEDGLSDNTDIEQEIVNKLSIEKAMKKLNKLQRTIIHLRYFEELTQAQVSRKLNINQPQVCRYEKKALKIMKGVLS